MPIYNFSKSLKQDFKPYTEIKIGKSIINSVDEIFTKYHKDFLDNFRSKKENISNSGILTQKLEDLLNIDLTGDYFGRDLLHPIMVAPGKHSRIGKKDDYCRLIRFRILEGYSGIILKTAIGNDKFKNCSMDNNRGDVYSPSYKLINETMFLSGERGAKLDIDEYCQSFLKDCIELGKKTETLIVPSILCGLPLQERLDEWKYTMDSIYQLSEYTEVDFSPTAFQEAEQLKQQVLHVFRWLRQSYPRKIFAIKIPGHFRHHMPIWIESVAKKIENTTQNYILFNRAISNLIIPWNLASVSTSIGSDAIFYPNMKILQNIYKNPEGGKKDNIPIEISYSGGIDTGIKAATAIGFSNAGSVQIATELLRQGGINALHRILGGLALYLHWIGNYLDKSYGLDVYSIKNLKKLFYREEIKEISEKYLQKPSKLVAVVNSAVCEGNCHVRNPAMDTNLCPASIVCPTYAFQYPITKPTQNIDKNLCIGCGNCSENCIRNAIDMKKG